MLFAWAKSSPLVPLAVEEGPFLFSSLRGSASDRGNPPFSLKPEWVESRQLQVALDHAKHKNASRLSGNAFRMGEKRPHGTARGGRGSFHPRFFAPPINQIPQKSPFAMYPTQNPCYYRINVPYYSANLLRDPNLFCPLSSCHPERSEGSST